MTEHVLPSEREPKLVGRSDAAREEGRGRAEGSPGGSPNGHDLVNEHVVVALRPEARVRWRTGRLVVGLTIAFDVAALVAANLLYLFGDDVTFGLPLLVLFDFVCLVLLFSRGLYGPRLKLDLLDDIRASVTATAVATLTIVFVDAMVSAAEPSSYRALELWLLASMALAGGRIISNRSASILRRTNGVTTLVAGAGHVGRLTAKRLIENPDLGLRPIGFLDSEPLEIAGQPPPLPVLGTSSDLDRIAAARHVECVVVAFSSDSHDETLRLLDECERLGIRALVVPRLFERVPSRLEVTHVGGLPLLEMHRTSPRSLQFAVKYALDRVLALVLIVLLAPLLAAIAVAVAISLGRPILYRQQRVSLDGRQFQMLKFRTMRSVPGASDVGQEFDPEIAPGGVEGPDRRTRLGMILRRWSLDELAQLFNVIRGEMSLVGPRPERPEYVEFFRSHVRRYGDRLRTKAGITGWAQIHSLRGKTSVVDRVEWDNYYIENFSLWLDLKILLRTIPEALRGRAD